jgi:hypothetical protein
MSALVPDPHDEPWSRSAMSKAAGISATTLENWTKRADGPLETVRIGDRVGFTWRLLLTFCDSHPTLQGARQVRARYREAFHLADAVSDPAPTQPFTGHQAASDARASAETLPAGNDVTLRAALHDMKGAVEQNATAVAVATELAAEAVRTQQHLLHCLEQLTAVCEGRERHHLEQSALTSDGA